MPSRNVQKILEPESYYHIYARGASKQTIFADDADFAYFLGLFERYLSNEPAVSKTGVPYPHFFGRTELLAYCLMGNHFHLLIRQEDETAMSELMRSVMTSYSRYFNLKYKRSGALFLLQDGPRGSDPINTNDYSGMAVCANWDFVCKTLIKEPKTTTKPTTTMQVIAQALNRAIASYRPVVRAVAKPKPKKSERALLKEKNDRVAGNFNKMMEAEKKRRATMPGVGDGERFNYPGAASSAVNWYYIGALAGGAAGCAVGALVTAGAAAAACIIYGSAWAGGGGLVGAGIGFFEGGYDSPRADDFDWGPDQLINPWTVR